MRAALSAAGHPQLHDLPRRYEHVRLLRDRRPRGGRGVPREPGVSARWQDAMADLLEERVPDGGPALARGDLPAGLSLSVVEFTEI